MVVPENKNKEWSINKDEEKWVMDIQLVNLFVIKRMFNQEEQRVVF